MAKLGLKASGAPMTIYTATDDTGFQFQAAVPVAQASTVPANSGITVGKSPAGKALKFVHRGSYDAMDSTYELLRLASSVALRCCEAPPASHS
jgi:effector-binding domain-containing protein